MKKDRIKAAHIEITHPFGDLTVAGIDMGGVNEVTATLRDGTKVQLFTYYPEELRFTEQEFVGLTVEQARQLHSDRDIAYLRS